ncbi:MAG TPA: DUF4956 domain-containing protein [Myxococcota bacterium]|jgi:hypothetical protein|nr:DUF4956 domain-containing protein [Myxococcota bacterium]
MTVRDFLDGALGLEHWSLKHFGEVLLRLVFAFGLGASLAYRPWRRLMRIRAVAASTETMQAQTIIAVAGAVVVTVIGDSLARAFGLAGLGAFVRFRSGIKDPRDVAIMFLMIGIGMACGLGLVPTATVGAIFAGTVMAAFDRFGKRRPHRLRVGITLDDPQAAYPGVRATLPGARAVDLPQVPGAPGKLVMEFDASEESDAATVLQSLRQAGVPGVRGVALEEE